MPSDNEVKAAQARYEGIFGKGGGGDVLPAEPASPGGSEPPPEPAPPEDKSEAVPAPAAGGGDNPPPEPSGGGEGKPAPDDAADSGGEAGGDEVWAPDGRLLMEAARMDMPYETAQAFGSDAALRTALEVLRTRIPAKPAGSQAAAGGAPPAPPTPFDLAKALESWPVLKPEDGYDEKLCQHSNAQRAAIEKVLAGLGDSVKAQVEAARGEAQAQAAILLEVAKFDDVLNDMGPEAEKAFGKGREDDLPPQFVRARAQLWDVYQDLRERAISEGRTVPRKELVKHALGVVNPGIVEDGVLRKAAEKAKARHKLRQPGTQVPTNPSETADEAAVRFLDEGLAKLRRGGK